MRANEFIIEGPLDSMADWMTGQTLGAEQAKKAKVQKQNTPKIAKLIQQNLEARVYRLFKQHQAQPVDDLTGEITKIIIGTISKITKTNITKNREAFGDSVGTLIKAIMEDLDNLKTSSRIYDAIEDVVTRSFAVKHTPSIDSKAITDKITKMLDAGATPEDIAKELAKDPDIDEKEAEVIAAKYSHTADDDEQTPGSKDRLTQFTAEVFYPQGKFSRQSDGEQLVYVNREGKWSLFRLVKRHEWEFVRAAGTEEEIMAIEQLIRHNELQPSPHEFNHLQQDVYQVV